MQRPIFASDLVQLSDVVLDISGRVPISLLELVLLGIQVLFAIRNRYIFAKLKTAEHTVGGREGCCQKCADQKSWTPTAPTKQRRSISGMGIEMATEQLLHPAPHEPAPEPAKLRFRSVPGQI